MGTGIKGFKSQKILKQKLKGYTEDQSIDYERYATIQELTGDKHGMDVVIHGAFNVNLAPLTVAAGSNIRVLKITAHGASKGDQVRFITSGVEAAVLSTPDADTIVLGSELSFDPAGLTVDIIRHVTPSYNSDGSLNVVTASSPVKFNKDGVATTVNYNTATPGSSDAFPVNIVTVNGQGISTTVDLTGAQINVQLSDGGTSPDSVRIGNGTNRMDVNANKEALVHDTDAITQLTSINANTDQIEPKLDTLNAILTNVISTNNSTGTPLAGGATFTGVADSLLNFAQVSVAMVTDQNGTLNIERSINGVNWEFLQTFAINVTTPGVIQGFSFGFPADAAYFRVRYVNGGTAQGTFRLQTVLNVVDVGGDTSEVQYPVLDTSHATTTKSVIYGKTTGGGGGYVAVKVNPSGALTVDATSNGANLATAANQATANNSLSSIDTKVTDGSQKTQIWDASSSLAATVTNSNTDAGSASTNRLRVGATLFGYNGSTIDRLRSGISGAITALTGYLNTIWVGKYNATEVSLTDGQLIEPQLDVRGKLKVNDNDIVAAGNITTQNLNLTGTATAGSAVEVDCDGKNTVGIQLDGTFTGIFAVAFTLNGSTWVQNSDKIIRQEKDGAFVLTITGAGIFSIPCAGLKKVRVQAIAAVTGTAVTTLISSKGTKISNDGVADVLLAAINTQLPAARGQTTKSGSLAVTMASDQYSGTVSSAQLTVGTSAVRATVAGTAPNSARKKLMIVPSGSNTGAIYLGGSSVSTSNGLPIIGPDRIEFFCDPSDYYLISDTAGQTVSVIEVV